jgi:hypothetical protein
VSKFKVDLSIIEDLLGEDFLPELAKAELYKPETGTVVSHSEMADALKIVPRAIMAWLSRCLSNMKDKENKVLDLPFKRAEEAQMYVTRVTSDVYHGELVRKGKILYRFKYRSIPGIGLILMTTFELYDMEDLHEKEPAAKEQLSYLSSMIEERIAFRNLVGQVVEEKIAQRDAIDQLVKLRMNSEFKKDMIKPSFSTEEEAKANKEPSKLKEFLDKRSKTKIEKKEGYTVILAKDESKSCPDCGQKIFDGSNITGCVCYGSDMGRKVFLKKNENGKMTVRFSKGWCPENIEMLLEILRKREKK